MTQLSNPLDDLMMDQQPIVKSTKEIFGYELLFRGTQNSHGKLFDGDKATSQVLVNLCIGITQIESKLKKPFFINMTTELILSEAFSSINPDTMYIEILEDQKITPKVIAAVKKWRKLGYKFVLDDYQFTNEYDLLLPLVSIVKVDVLATNPEQYAKKIEALKKKGLILIAEKVEDTAMFELCKTLNFDLFQGFFLQRPEIIKGKKIDTSIHNAISLVNALQNHDISIEKVADLVEKSPKLSFQLLRILNSPVCGIPKKVTSIKEAVIFLGLTQLKKWALLITLSSSSDQPSSILKILLTRGYCCQLLAEKNKSNQTESAFMVGLISGVDLLFGMDKKRILNEIALSKESFEAIINQTGELGSYLKQTLSCEEQNWKEISTMHSTSRANLNHAFLDAMVWSEEVTKSIN